MENLNEIKLKLIQRVCELDNLHLLSAFLKNIENRSVNLVSEPDSAYQNEEPMSDEEVGAYFFTEVQKELIFLAEDDIKFGRTITDEEVKKLDEEWMK